MSQQKKGYNSVLLFFGILGTTLAIYFGFRTSQLNNKLSKTVLKLEAQQPLLVNDSIAVIDSLLFRGDYKKAFQLSKELKQTKKFSTDSVLQLRYNLASVIITAEGNAPQEFLKVNDSGGVTNKKYSSVEKKKTTAEKLVDTKERVVSLTRKLTAKSTSGEYLTFETSKGTKLHYIGYIKNNQANGHGIAILDSGSRYEGHWENNKRHGLGKFYWDDGDYYEGTYHNDKRDGMGTYHWKNGDKYIGEWKDDQRNGKGQFFTKKGKLKASGIWENDELITKDKKH